MDHFARLHVDHHTRALDSTLASVVLSVDATGIPTDGRVIYVRLQYLFDGEWKFVDYTYTALDIVPEVLTPIPGATLSGSDVTFTWDTHGGLFDDWTLYVGSNFGASDLLNSGSLGAGVTSVDVNGLPTDGRTLYVRLRYLSNAVWSSIDYVYTAADLAPELVTPSPGSVLSGSSATFTWTSHGSPVQTWVLEVGSSPGLSNPNRKIFEARKRETAALGAGEKLVLGHPLAATIGDSARCMQNLEKVLFTGPKTSDTVTFICD